MRGRKKYLNESEIRDKSFTIKLNLKEKEVLEKNPQIKKELKEYVREQIKVYQME